ncbi:MAG: 50S ribosome-binding GTPase, partial [Oscillospiraceae bacterium]|nr:50S ribosome-binding GTPase [Oscillospiraceae bacterium]
RVMAAGIPNSGKSSFINRMAGSRKTAVGDKPGVTRGKQWIRIGGTGGAGGKGGKSTPLEILDLPGVLEPKIEDKQAALHLAYTGAVRDAVMDTLALARNLGAFLLLNHTDKFAARYGLSECGGDILEAIAQARSMRIAGGQLDLERAAAALLDDFRSAKIGKITLELPPVRV